MTVGVGVRGTFADVVHWEGERLSTAKVSSA